MKDGLTALIFALIGPSASGKTTLMEATVKGYHTTRDKEKIDLLDKYKDISKGLVKIVTVTTRQPRPGEIDGVHYKFLSRDEFKSKKEDGSLIGDTVYAGEHYGIPKEDIDIILRGGMNAVITVDIKGIEKLKEIYGTKRVVSIFIYRDISEIFEELKRRPNDEKEFFARFESVKEELEIMHQCDKTVFNVGPIEGVIENLFEIIEESIESK